MILVALLVCLIPTTIGGLLSAIGIAGMDRVTRFNVLAMSGRAVEAAGDVDTLLLDKTGTITFGNRLAAEFVPVGGASQERWSGGLLREPRRRDARGPEHRHAGPAARRRADTPRTAHGARRCSGPAASWSGPASARRGHRRGAGARPARRRGRAVHGRDPDERPADERHRADEGRRRRDRRARRSSWRRPTSRRRPSGSPARAARRWRSAENGQILGLVYLKDTVKPGMRERFDELRRMGIRTIMITGDNRLTAATIAREAGVDDFVAEAKPEDKIDIIREQQAQGNLVAMTGDGTNDAPALAQADVGLAMNSRHRGGQGGGQHGRPRLRPDQADRGGR